MIQFFSFQFSSAHFYNQPVWSKEKNQEVFGACYDPHGHGHNYRLEVGVISQDQEQVNKDTISGALAPVLKTLDHHHLNFEIEWFKNNVPTTENIALFIADKIKSSIPELKVIRLYEAPDLWVELKV